MTDDPDAWMAFILNHPDATPEDVKGVADSGAVTQAQARAWLVGYLAGLRAAPPTHPREDHAAIIPTLSVKSDTLT